MSVRSGYGPTLPEIAAERFGVPRRKAAIVLAAGFLALVAFALILRGGDGKKEFRHDGTPAFALRYPTHLMTPVKAELGEIVRFETRRGALAITVGISAIDFPGKRFSDLPVVAAQHADAVREQIPGVEFREEGRTRLNRQPAYEVNYRYGPPGRRTGGRDVLLFPDETGLRHGVLISFRTVKPGGPLTEKDRDAIKLVRRGAHSLLFE